MDVLFYGNQRCQGSCRTFIERHSKPGLAPDLHSHVYLIDAIMQIKVDLAKKIAVGNRFSSPISFEVEFEGKPLKLWRILSDPINFIDKANNECYTIGLSSDGDIIESVTNVDDGTTVNRILDMNSDELRQSEELADFIMTAKLCAIFSCLCQNQKLGNHATHLSRLLRMLQHDILLEAMFNVAKLPGF